MKITGYRVENYVMQMDRLSLTPTIQSAMT